MPSEPWIEKRLFNQLNIIFNSDKYKNDPVYIGAAHNTTAVYYYFFTIIISTGLKAFLG